jgi:hypothetical protein
MKSSLFSVAAAAVLLAAPLAAFAQQADQPQSDQQPLTRAEVRAQLVQIQQAGYRGDDNTTYPAGIQAAEAKVTGGADQQSTQTGYGGVMVPGSQSGAASGTPNDGTKPLYFGQ